MLTQKIRYITILLSAIGICSALIFCFKFGVVVEPIPAQIGLPHSSPFDQSIAGSGIVEANTHNITVGSNVSGIISKILVKEGDLVKKGELLFTLDNRAALANVTFSEKQLTEAQTSLEVAKVSLDAELDKEARLKQLTKGFSVSVDEQQRQYFAVQHAKATLSNAKAVIDTSSAQLDIAKTSLALLSVTSPLTGTVLDIYLREGELINLNTEPKGVILIGNIDPLYIKVQIDESDINRFTANANAIAFQRDNKEITFPLEFVQILPYVQPKTQFSNVTTEIVDTRILQILYKINTSSPKLFTGQLLDVFIQVEK